MKTFVITDLPSEQLFSLSRFVDISPQNRLTPGKLIPILEIFSSQRKIHPVWWLIPSVIRP